MLPLRKLLRRKKRQLPKLVRSFYEKGGFYRPFLLRSACFHLAFYAKYARDCLAFQEVVMVIAVAIAGIVLAVAGVAGHF